MELFRFMSKKEFDKLIKGEKLYNKKKHQGRTNSVGFCFMKVEDNTPEYAYHFLSGVVDDDVCVVFETDKKLTESWGVYADPNGSFFATITEDEYCTTEYSLNDFKIVRMAIPEFWKEEWIWETDTTKIVAKLDEIEKKRKEKEKKRKAIEKVEEQILKEQSLKFEEFYQIVQKTHTIDIKIGDKYYKLRGWIDSFECNPDLFCGVPVGNERIITFKCEL